MKRFLPLLLAVVLIGNLLLSPSTALETDESIQEK